jgi:hypothetical protein
MMFKQQITTMPKIYNICDGDWQNGTRCGIYDFALWRRKVVNVVVTWKRAPAVVVIAGVTYSFFPHTHFSPRKNEYILNFPPTVSLWNNLDLNVKNSPNISCFKSRIKEKTVKSPEY